MTPEQLTEFEQLKQTVESLVVFSNSLESQSTLPKDVESAFRKRLRIGTASNLAPQTKSVNESGGASYTVALPMTGFIKIIDENGNSRNVPYY